MGAYQLIYQSQSMVPFETPELLTMLRKARAYNARLGITGLLLLTPDGRFLQVLEGRRDDVRALYYQRIAADPRHYNCRVYDEGPCWERAFPQWRMGFRPATAQVLRTLLSYVPPDGPGLLVPRPHTRAELLALLQDFVTTGEGVLELEELA
ncbi:BLUF domain-containing protein [Hymenobacter daeguensis]